MSAPEYKDKQELHRRNPECFTSVRVSVSIPNHVALLFSNTYVCTFASLLSYLDNLDKCHVKGTERGAMNGTQLCVSTIQRSEQGYLNLTMPSVPPEPRDK